MKLKACYNIMGKGKASRTSALQFAAFVISNSLTTKLAIMELVTVSVAIWVWLILKLLMIVYATVHHINRGGDNNNFDEEGVVELSTDSCLCMIVY